MYGSFADSLGVMILLAIPSQVIWSYSVGGVVFAIGLAVIFLRGDWQRARRFDKLILFGPLFYAAPIAAFGTEHFMFAQAIATMVPSWIPWHLFWAYFLGVCFIAAALSLVTRIQTRLAASLLALTFFLFVVLMDVPGWLQNPRDRIALALALRELSFSGGALALAASLSGEGRDRGAHNVTHHLKPILTTIARYFVAIPVLFYSFEQFMHGDYVPGSSAGPPHSHIHFRPRHLDVRRRRGLLSRGNPVAARQENPRRRCVGGLDCPFRGVGRLPADRNRGPRQHGQRPQLCVRHADVLRRRPAARRRHAARIIA